MDLGGCGMRPEHSVSPSSVREGRDGFKALGPDSGCSRDFERANGPRERPNRVRAFGVVLAAAAAAVPAPAPTPPAAITADASYGTRVISLENAERAHAGCQPLRADPAITAAATEHARDMGAKNFLGHDSSTGVSPWARMKAAGYDAP